MPGLTRKTKIVATVGPVSSSPEMIQKLMQAGVDIFRLNFSHGENSQKLELIRIIRQVSDTLGHQAGILGDLQGPKIRTGKMADDGMLLTKGQEVVITTDDVLGSDGVIPTIYKSLPHDVHPGSRILLDDGLLELTDHDLIREAMSYSRDDLMDKEIDPRLTTRHFDLLTACAISFQMKDYVEINQAQDWEVEEEITHSAIGI